MGWLTLHAEATLQMQSVACCQTKFAHVALKHTRVVPPQAPSGSASPRAQQQYIQQQALQAAAYREQMLRRVGGAGR